MSDMCQKNPVLQLIILFLFLCVFFILSTTTQTGFWIQNRIESQQKGCTSMCMKKLLQNNTDEVSLCGEKASSRGQGQR